MFEWGKFTGHSGEKLDWKIECDVLTDEDIECLASVINKWLSFRKVIGIPRGGMRFANALQKYCNPSARGIIIVDDVLTTGRSMEEKRNELMKTEDGPIYGVVIFARGKSPAWVFPIFELCRIWWGWI